MAKLQLSEEHIQADLDAHIMEQAEKKELEAMRERMNLLLRDYYKEDSRPASFQIAVKTKHEQGATTAIHAAQGENHGNKD